MCARLGVPSQEVARCFGSCDLAGLKAAVKAAWRAKALELHPDWGGDEDEFKVCSDIVDRINAIGQLVRQPPRPGFRTIVVRRYCSYGFDQDSTSTQTSTGGWSWSGGFTWYQG
jgi:hypothetical protein